MILGLEKYIASQKEYYNLLGKSSTQDPSKSSSIIDCLSLGYSGLQKLHLSSYIIAFYNGFPYIEGARYMLENSLIASNEAKFFTKPHI